MTYEETLDYLYTSTPVFEHVGASAYKPGLQTTEALDRHYGQPHRHYMTLHVAGTNGKGSTSHTLAAILQTAGLRVGLYTSPHLVDFRERIRVNGECISKERVISFVEDFREWNTTLQPSFFELTTALAFKYFEEQKVDIAVIEVGLGGRLDSTNIIRPRLSVITNISFDHTQFLGNTLAEIAAEKAGIIKQSVPVVIGETTPETRPVFLQKAQEQKAPIIFAEELPAPPHRLQEAFELKGSYQHKNMKTILCALEVISKELPEIKHYLEKPEALPFALSHVSTLTGLRGRWETLQKSPLVVCDTGHNLAGWQYLAPQIKAQPADGLRLVFGMVDDKDIDGVLALLKEISLARPVHFYFTQASTHRAIPATKVAEKALAMGIPGCVYDSVAKAYRAALDEADDDDFIFVGGSSYVVADLLTELTPSETCTS